MADPTKPPGVSTTPSATSPSISAPVIDPAAFLELREFLDRLNDVKKIADEASVAVAKAFQENITKSIKDSRNASGVEFQAFSQYLSDLKREYASLASVAEQNIKDILKENTRLGEQGTKNTQNLTEAYKKLNESISSLNISQKLKDLLNATSVDNIGAKFSVVSENIKQINEQLATNEKNLIVAKEGVDAISKSFGANEKQANIFAEEILRINALLDDGRLAKEEHLRLTKELFALQKAMQDAGLKNDEIEQVRQLAIGMREVGNLEKESLQYQKDSKITLEQLATVKKILDPIGELEIEKKRVEIQQKLNDLKLKEAVAMEPLIRMDRMRTEGLENVNKQFNKYADAILPGSTATNTFASAMLSMAFATDKSGNAIDNLTKSIKTGFRDAFLDPQKAMNSFTNFMYDNVIKSTFEFDKQLAQINKETGGFRKEFEEVAMNKGALFSSTDIGNLSMYGMKLSDVANVYKGLSTNMLGFNNLAKSQREILLQNSAELTTLGLNSATYGTLVTKFMGAAGKSAIEASDLMNRVAKDAIGLGQDVQKYAEGLSTAMSKISGFARDATAIYRELSAVAQATKGVLNVADLTALSEGFSTFDKAAESVSKLNSMLGGTSLSIVDMMQKDPAEQIMAIKRAASDASLDFDKLNIGYKRLLAEYFGGDINKAAAFFKMDIAEANKLINEGSASEKELAERREQSAAAQEKLAATLERMQLALTPITNIINFALTGVNKFIDVFGALPTFIGIAVFAFIRVKRAVASIKAEAVAAGKSFTDAFSQSNQNIQQMIGSLKVLVTQLQKGTEAADKLEQELKQAAAANKELESGGGGGGGGAPKGKFGKAMSAIGGFLSDERVLMAITGVSMAAGMINSLSEPSPVEGKDFLMTADPKTGNIRKLADYAPTDKLKIEASQSSNFIDKSSSQMQSSYDSTSAPSYISQATSSNIFNGGDNVFGGALAAEAATKFYEKSSIVNQKQMESNERLREATEKNTSSVIANNSSSNQISQTNDRLLSSTYERNREMREGSSAVYTETSTAIASAAGQAAVAAMSATTNNLGGNVNNSATTNNYTGGAMPPIMLSIDNQILGRLAQRAAPEVATQLQTAGI